MSIRKCQCRCCRERENKKKAMGVRRMRALIEKAEANGMVFEKVAVPTLKKVVVPTPEQLGLVAPKKSPPSPASRAATAGEENSPRGNCVECCWLGLTSALNSTVAESEAAIRYHFRGLYDMGHASATKGLAERLEGVRGELRKYNYIRAGATILDFDKHAQKALVTLTALIEELKG
jgi:hypothetical protein